MGGCDSTQKTAQPAAQNEPVVVIEASPEPLKEVLPEEKTDAHKKLIFNTKLSVSPERPNWVLFSNGTHLLFPVGTTKEDMRKTSLGLLQRYNNESFKVRKSPIVKGWVARTPKGIYNYVSLVQASSRLATNKELASIGKQNVMKDKANPVIIHINIPKQ
ncbi:hypothetical protein DCS32_01930 [Dokdonia sp. Dokd-P16]|nr:hypothetical protein DCS32_01930 [Dokdonia sp. Dokd-P16]